LIHDFESLPGVFSGAAPPREGVVQEGPAPLAGKPLWWLTPNRGFSTARRGEREAEHPAKSHWCESDQEGRKRLNCNADRRAACRRGSQVSWLFFEVSDLSAEDQIFADAEMLQRALDLTAPKGRRTPL
jgi:hypothetical protein